MGKKSIIIFLSIFSSFLIVFSVYKHVETGLVKNEVSQLLKFNEGNIQEARENARIAESEAVKQRDIAMEALKEADLLRKRLKESEEALKKCK